MPIIEIKNAIDRGEISIIPCKVLPLHPQWNLVWLKNKKLSIVGEAFITYIKQEKLNIKNKFFDWIKE